MSQLDEHAHDWIELQLDCETCGVESHDGLMCRACLTTVDFVWTADPR